MNKVCLIGRIIRKPTLKTTRNGEEYIRYSLQTGARDSAQIIPCDIYGQANVDFAVKYIRSGMYVGVVGKLCMGRDDRLIVRVSEQYTIPHERDKPRFETIEFENEFEEV